MDRDLYGHLLEKLLKFRLPLAFITSLIVLAAGITIKFSDLDFQRNAVKASAEIAGVTERGYPVLLYTVDGKEYLVRLRSLIPGKPIGSQIEVEYHKTKPENVQVGPNPLGKTSTWMVVIGSAGAVMLGLILFRKKPD